MQEQLEAEHSEEMNTEAVDRIRQEALTQADADRIEQVWFEDDEVVKLRDGKTYRIAPASLKDARKLMRFLRSVNVDAIILNFIPTGDEKADDERENNLYQTLEIAFKGHNLSRDYLDEHVDVEIARKIIDIVIGLNGIKK